jgi:hypothetical protein
MFFRLKSDAVYYLKTHTKEFQKKIKVIPCQRIKVEPWGAAIEKGFTVVLR